MECQPSIPVFDDENLTTEFRGFSLEVCDNANQMRLKTAEATRRCEAAITDEAKQLFLGFNLEEIAESNVRRRKFRDVARNFEIGPSLFLGFEETELKHAASTTSQLSEQCVKLQTNIYKTVNRRFLGNYTKDNSLREKMVGSRYFAQNLKLPVKSEDGTWSAEAKIADVFPVESRIKVEKEPHLDRELAIVSEIHKLNKELDQIRKLKQAATEQVKLKTSPFFQVKSELSLPRFVPPKSPHNLLEEELYVDPWSLLVATIFMNKTSAQTARPYVFWFLEENPDPFTVVGKKVEELESYFGALGLQKIRAKQVWKMSYDFLYKDWKQVGELHGVGTYGEHAFRMFCLGDFSVEPKDRYLRIYKSWYHMQDKQARLEEMNS